MSRALRTSGNYILSNPIVRKPWRWSISADVLARPSLLRWPTPPSEPDEPLILITGSSESGWSILISDDAPAALTEAVHSLVRLLDLPLGWDSYRAKQIDVASVLRGIRVLSEIMTEGDIPKPHIVPLISGGV